MSKLLRITEICGWLLLACLREVGDYIVWGMFVYAFLSLACLAAVRCKYSEGQTIFYTRDSVRALSCYAGLVLLEALRYLWDRHHSTHFPMRASQVALILLLSGTGTFVFRLIPPKEHDSRQRP